MELIGIAYGVSNLSYGKLCGEKKLCRAGHAVFDQVFLRPLANPFFEQFQKLVSVDVAALGNGLYGNIVHKIFFNIEKRGLEIVVRQASGGAEGNVLVSRAPDEAVCKLIQL